MPINRILLIVTSLFFSTLIVADPGAPTYDPNRNNPPRTSDTPVYQQDNSVLGGDLTGGFGRGNVETGNLTDEEKHLSENYMHDGYSQRMMDEECGKDGDTQAACDGDEPETINKDVDTAVAVVSKIYGMFGGLVGGDIEITTTNADGTEGTESKSDYCKYIPMASEAGAQVFMEQNQESIESIPGEEDGAATSSQKRQLYQAAMSHEGRADAAEMQVYGWGGTTACYTWLTTSSLMTGTPDPMIYLKLGAAGFLTYFYNEQKSANEDAAKKVRAIADKLPGKGDCNPITDTACYCAQEETKDDPQYCGPATFRKRARKGIIASSCVDNKGRPDPSCRCLDSKNCFDSTFFTNFPDVANGKAFGISVASSVRDISTGTFKSGGIGGSTGKNVAAGMKAMKLANDKLPKFSGRLNGDQSKQAGELERMGVPANLAKSLAAQRMSPNARRAAGRIRGRFSSPRRYAGYRRSGGKKSSKDNALYFGGGSGLKNKKNSGKSNNLAFLKKFKKKGKNAGAGNKGQVFKFADKAAQEAQINKRPDKIIFEIISRRYQMSGREKLGL